MTAPDSTIDESDLIQQEIAAAKDALNRYCDLTAKEHQEQQARLTSIEWRIGLLEQATEALRLEVKSMMDSRIWQTLVKGSKLIEKVSSRTGGEGG
jgi:hypothetical protein